MKIQAPQSQNSFKAIYKPTNATYTEEQIKIINDINKKLKKDIDIFIKPNDTNSINLYKLDGIEKDENEKLNYKTCKFIGTYNEENPFKFWMKL